MRTSSLSRPRSRNTITIEQVLLTGVLGFALFFAAIAVYILGYQIGYMGRIYPGVSVAGIDLSGLSPADASEKIIENLPYPRKGNILFYDGDRYWLATPADLGMLLDADRSASSAFEIGRSGGPFRRLMERYSVLSGKHDVAPVFILDENLAYRYLGALASQIDLATVEPSLSIDGTNVVVHPGQTGRKLDVSSTMAALTTQILSMQDSAVSLIVQETPPEIVDVSAQADLARSIIGQTLSLEMPQDQPDQQGAWTFDSQALAAMLSFEYVQTDAGVVYQVTLDSTILRDFLTNLAPALELQSKNTRFMFNDDTHLLEVIEPAVIGRSLDVEASLAGIQQALLNGQHTVTLVIQSNAPAVTDDMTGEQLGITELVHEEISYFYGSSSERVQNIEAASRNFHGLLVAPGETFSMAENMSDITLDNGYAEALIIYGNQTIKGVGGGVCQVSTTLFRAAFFTGFPIVERHPHAYRVSYYEKVAGNRRDPNLAGLDATVFVPLVDLKFTNDTPYWLLMEVYVNPSYDTIWWKFYSTSDGRVVDWETTGPTNIIEAPDTLYRENPDLPQGEVRQVEWPADGAEITVNRTVYRDNEILFHDTFYTQYEPWQSVFEYGPGTEGMPPPPDPANVDGTQ
jgi:vancomycin resistance protein YoaR